MKVVLGRAQRPITYLMEARDDFMVVSHKPPLLCVVIRVRAYGSYVLDGCHQALATSQPMLHNMYFSTQTLFKEHKAPSIQERCTPLWSQSHPISKTPSTPHSEVLVSPKSPPLIAS